MLKNYLAALCLWAVSIAHAQYPVLKQIKVVQKFYKTSKNGEIINKDILFKEGKLASVKTSDVIQHFFYDENGLLNKTTKERVGSDWKEVTGFKYDPDGRILQFSKKYQEGNEYVTKSVKFTYEGARIKAEAKRSNSHQQLVEDVEYVVENGLIARRVLRDRNKQIIGKTEYAYNNGNVTRHTGLVGDKSIKMFTYDDKGSADLLIVQNLFGVHYKVITPLISFYDEEFDFQSISENNELTFKATSDKYTPISKKFKYNAQNYPQTSHVIEGDGLVVTDATYYYE
ncbi:hypothetical protein [Flavobacterium agrisoli]|uniref:YD repeat-containing protein n=1 Tax=Flavobacterium agrisoli TaxID=2793066 RepID=A0A934PLZ8_9FLAO|nr:hypothetical protein [Flavobacterium agrisoli]MBK0369759.1 hypothetical protein [Flavobacterium agrisoli]